MHVNENKVSNSNHNNSIQSEQFKYMFDPRPTWILTAYDAIKLESDQTLTLHPRFSMKKIGKVNTIHLHQELGLYSAAGLVFLWGAPPTAHGVYLIYEDGSGSVEASLCEEKAFRRTPKWNKVERKPLKSLESK